MDPVTLIVLALAAGIAAGAKSTAESAVKDAYDGVKSILKRKYNPPSLGSLEAKPESELKQASLREDLAETEAGKDEELLRKVDELVETLKSQQGEVKEIIGIDIEEIKAESLKIQKVISEGSGIQIKKSEFKGNIDIGEVNAGGMQGNS